MTNWGPRFAAHCGGAESWPARRGRREPPHHLQTARTAGLGRTPSLWYRASKILPDRALIDAPADIANGGLRSSGAASPDGRCASTPAGESFEANIVRHVELTGSKLLPGSPIEAASSNRELHDAVCNKHSKSDSGGAWAKDLLLVYIGTITLSGSGLQSPSMSREGPRVWDRAR